RGRIEDRLLDVGVLGQLLGDLRDQLLLGLRRVVARLLELLEQLLHGLVIVLQQRDRVHIYPLVVRRLRTPAVPSRRRPTLAGLDVGESSGGLIRYRLPLMLRRTGAVSSCRMPGSGAIRRVRYA